LTLLKTNLLGLVSALMVNNFQLMEQFEVLWPSEMQLQLTDPAISVKLLVCEIKLFAHEHLVVEELIRVVLFVYLSLLFLIH